MDKLIEKAAESRKLFIFASIIMFIFLIIGLMVTSTTIHELSHYQDFKTYVNDDSVLCFFSIPGNETGIHNIFNSYLGYYDFTYNSHDKELDNKISTISKYTELKAYSIQFIFMLLFSVICIIVILHFIHLTYKIKIYESESELR